MLLRVILKNFLSFDSEMQFDMFPNMKRTQLSNHIYTELCDINILKQAAIYGSNGAGKSNLVKALEFIRAFALDKDFIKSIELEKFYFLLKELNTKSLIISTLSLTDSFLASYLLLRRSSNYAIIYIINDIILITLWLTTTLNNGLMHLPIIMSFIIFLINDIYGLILWKVREKKQK